jgi:hypothetical protein
MALRMYGCGDAIEQLGGVNFGRMTGEYSCIGCHILHTTCEHANRVLAHRLTQSPSAVKSPDCQWPCMKAGLISARVSFGHLPHKLQLNST